MDWLATLTRCGVKPGTAARWAPVFDKHCKPERFSLGAEEVDDFLGNVLHESGRLERLEEGLNYSSERLMAVWPKRFPTMSAAIPYARNPEKLANYVYGGRLGNVLPDDGWVCRGSGLVQVTGLANMQRLAPALGFSDPRALAQALRTNPEVALQASIMWWEKSVPDAFIGDAEKVRRAVNGGTLGLDDTRRLAGLADGDGDGRLG